MRHRFTTLPLLDISHGRDPQIAIAVVVFWTRTFAKKFALFAEGLGTKKLPELNVHKSEKIADMTANHVR